MKTMLTGIIAGMMLCGISLAQSTMPPQTNDPTLPTQPAPQTTQSAPTGGQPVGTPRVAPGSVIPVQLTKSIDAKKVKSGDAVEAKVTQDMKTGNGEVLVPKDTRVVGHVTEAQPRSKEQKESQVGIAFDHAIMKNGDEMPMPMSIQAIIAPAALNPDAGAGPPQSAPSAGGTSPGNTSGRSGGMSPGTPSPSMSGGSGSGGQLPTNAQTGTDAHQPITGNTKGVVGISDMQLSAVADKTQGSIVSSEKNNVKLDSGTLMLLRVDQ
jgi:hypothetical protein